MRNRNILKAGNYRYLETVVLAPPNRKQLPMNEEVIRAEWIRIRPIRAKESLQESFRKAFDA